ncbi:MAG: hypothetical protein Q9M91_06975 [Candidatus Dojkabacteria bacterium]|nr:hypothetical protein [Candidatus Dojkabacteria bacterium]MDQ7021535.1 hypothetical protein [Candidatus Dojkabacteria bacterium]
MILITAPHTIKTLRLKNFIPQIHKNEVGLFEIGKELSKEKGIKFIPNKRSIIDPNYHRISRYRTKINIGQEYNFDLHGMTDDHGCDLEIGTAGVVYNLEEINVFLDYNSISYKINEHFVAGERTITHMMNNGLEIKGVQIELSKEFRLDFQNRIKILREVIMLFSKYN